MNSLKIKGEAKVDTKLYNFTIVYLPSTGSVASLSTSDEIKRVRPDFPFTMVPVELTEPFEQTHVEQTIASSKMVIAVLSKGCLKDERYIFALDCALHYKVRIMLLHDQASCLFPGELEQPQTLLKGGVFKDKAVTFMKQYVSTCVDSVLRKYQRFIDSKKQHDFLVLFQTRDGEDLDAMLNQPFPQDFEQYIEMFIRNATYITTSVPQAFTEEEDPSEPTPEDANNLLFKELSDEHKEKLRKVVSNCHSIFFLPQGRRGNRTIIISRAEMFIYQIALEYNTTIHIIDQHGVYGLQLLKFAARYKIANIQDILQIVSLHPPFRHIGVQIINSEKKRGGCKSLATSTRVFISHKRSSAQGMAGRIYEGLHDDYYCFLDSEADFDLHDLELIVKQTEVFLFILSEGIFDSFWCLQELRSAITYGKKILIIRDYRFEIPAQLPDSVKDLAAFFRDTKTLDYLAEFFAPFLAELKSFIGVSDELIMTCDAQVTSSNNPDQLSDIKAGKITGPWELSVVPDAVIDSLTAPQFIRYFEYYGNDPKWIMDMPCKCVTVNDFLYLSKRCPEYNGVLVLPNTFTDYQILQVFDGKRFQRVPQIVMGNEFESLGLGISGEALKALLKYLPNLTGLFLYHCNSITAESWKVIGSSNLKKLGVVDCNYKPIPGVNIPPKLNFVYGVKAEDAEIFRNAVPGIDIQTAN